MQYHPAALRAAGYHTKQAFDMSQLSSIWGSLPGPLKAALLTGGVGALTGAFSDTPARSMLTRGLGFGMLGGAGAMAWPYLRSALGNGGFASGFRGPGGGQEPAPAGAALPPPPAAPPVEPAPFTNTPSLPGPSGVAVPGTQSWADQWSGMTNPMTPPVPSPMAQPGQGFTGWDAASTLR